MIHSLIGNHKVRLTLVRKNYQFTNGFILCFVCAMKDTQLRVIAIMEFSRNCSHVLVGSGEKKATPRRKRE